MICYFWEGFKPSIKVEMEQQDRESMNFEEMMQRAVNEETKAGLKSSIMVRDSDIHCPRGHRPSNSTASKVQAHGTTTKDSFCLEKPKAKETKSVHANAVEPSEQDKKDNKNQRDKKRRFWERRKRSNTPATGNNTIDVSKKKKKNRDCDTSRVTCYNYNKKSHIPNTCTEPKN